MKIFKFQCFLILTVALLSAPAFAAFAGSEGRGGGDSLSQKIRGLEKLIGENGNKIKPLLIQIMTNLRKFDPSGKTPQQIISLIDRGLREDVSLSLYQLEAKCIDKKNEERSASTQKTTVDKDPKRYHPPICINLRRLAIENAKLHEVIGLLFHEHARHFGLEDTDSFGIHPIAEFITAERIELLTSEEITKADPLLKDTALLIEDANQDNPPVSYVNLKIFTTHPENTIFSIDSLMGDCNTRSGIDTDGPDGYPRRLGSVVAGFKYQQLARLQLWMSTDQKSDNENCYVKFAISDERSSALAPMTGNFKNTYGIEIIPVGLNDDLESTGSFSHIKAGKIRDFSGGEFVGTIDGTGKECRLSVSGPEHENSDGFDFISLEQPIETSADVNLNQACKQITFEFSTQVGSETVNLKNDPQCNPVEYSFVSPKQRYTCKNLTPLAKRR